MHRLPGVLPGVMCKRVSGVLFLPPGLSRMMNIWNLGRPMHRLPTSRPASFPLLLMIQIVGDPNHREAYLFL